MGSLDQRALAIVESCIDLDDAARDRFVTESCGAVPDLRAKVERMLAMDRTGFRLLPTGSTFEPEFVADPVPERIGAFRIAKIIGRGGMGTVVRAERDDQVYHQTVAIKLIRTGLKDAKARERFALERQILARLSHPGIARIIDGGAVDDRPYLVMEFVEGAPVTLALETSQATQSERLDLFEAVCDAVSHAHRNLVVHADIKPSNVIATAEGGIKLLDFGISRLIVDLDRDELAGPYPLTRGYAAPERIAGDPPTVASDVYSLGVLLHEMLTGVVPGATPTSARDADAGRLGGDLAAIVTEATAPESSDRYPDVAALTADLHRYRQQRPVLARASTWRYRASRFLSRNRVPVALGVLVALLLSAATAVSLSLFVEARRQQAQAEQRFGEVRQLSRFMLFDLYDELSNSPGTVAARVRIAETGGRYLDRLRALPAAPPDLRLESAAGYRRLATVQGLPATSSLGRPSDAGRSLKLGEELLRSVLAEQPQNAEALEEMGWLLLARWTLLADNKQSPLLNERARRYFDAALKVDPARSRALLGRLTTLKNVGYDLIWSDRPKEALPVLRGALAQLRQTPFAEHDRDDALLLETNLLNRIGDAVYYGGDIPASLRFYEESNRIVDHQLAKAETPRWLDRRGEAMWNLSGTLVDIPGRGLEALVAANRGISAMESLLHFGPDASAQKRLLVLQGQKALILAKLGRNADAARASALTVAMREERYRLEPHDPARARDLAVALTPHATLLARVGDRGGACEAARKAVTLWTQIRRMNQLSSFDAARQLPPARKASQLYCVGR